METTTLLLAPDKSLDENLEVVTFTNEGYRSLQELVGGYIEFMEISVGGHVYDMMFHEEGKLIGLPPTLALIMGGAIHDIVVGKIFFFKLNEDGDTIGLDQEDIDRIREYFESSTLVASHGDKELPVYQFEGGY